MAGNEEVSFAESEDYVTCADSYGERQQEERSDGASETDDKETTYTTSEKPGE